MSEIEHKTTPKSEHGTTKSYVIGFILSLIFTFIPYYLVVEKVVSGSALLGTILAFAVLQMVIQVVFFLHLGREKKPYWQRSFLLATIGGITVVVGGSIWIMGHLHYNMTPVTPDDISKKLIEDEGIYEIGGEKTGACRGVYQNHKVIIKDGVVSPGRIEAKKCDTLTFLNQDSDKRYMTFGTHPHHGVYAGESQLTVTNRRAKSITLSETGEYQFHDHLHPETAGYFTVTP